MSGGFRDRIKIKYLLLTPDFEVFTATKFRVQVCGVVTPYSDAVRILRFGGPFCLALKMEAEKSPET
jgi:hypothetical protein